jgi:hypothetical protein
MSSNLELYKINRINQLTKDYNAQIKVLTVQLNNTISYINSLRIPNSTKILNKNMFIRNYNISVSNLKNKYILLMKDINLLTEIQKNKNALLIGINYIGTRNELSGCINDTINVQNLLQTKYAFKNFTFLTDITNKKPTKQNIINELISLLVNSETGDTLFLLFSGHGITTVDLNGDEIDRQDECIVPINATNISTCIVDDELKNIIQKNAKPGTILFAIFDSCFSGTVLDLKYNYLTDDNIVINKYATEITSDVYMISGCKDSQTSADSYVNYNNSNMSSGALTYVFLETIKQLGTNISLKVLMESMRNLLKVNGYDQIPQLSCSKQIDINNLLPL